MSHNMAFSKFHTCRKGNKLQEIKERENRSLEKRKTKLATNLEMLKKETNKFTFDEKQSLVCKENKDFIEKIEKMKSPRKITVKDAKNKEEEKFQPSKLPSRVSSDIDLSRSKTKKVSSLKFSNGIRRSTYDIVKDILLDEDLKNDSFFHRKNKNSSSISPMILNRKSSAMSLLFSPVKKQGEEFRYKDNSSSIVSEFSSFILPKISNNEYTLKDSEIESKIFEIPQLLNLSPNFGPKISSLDIKPNLVKDNANANTNIPDINTPDINIPNKISKSKSESPPKRTIHDKNKNTLMKLYNMNNEYLKNMKEFKNDVQFKNESSIDEYQHKIIELAKDTLSNQALWSLSNDLKDVAFLGKREKIKKLKISKWSETCKRIRHLIPDYLADKFYEL